MHRLATPGSWYRAYGNENWDFAENGQMKRRQAVRLNLLELPNLCIFPIFWQIFLKYCSSFDTVWCCWVQASINNVAIMESVAERQFWHDLARILSIVSLNQVLSTYYGCAVSQPEPQHWRNGDFSGLWDHGLLTFLGSKGSKIDLVAFKIVTYVSVSVHKWRSRWTGFLWFSQKLTFQRRLHKYVQYMNNIYILTYTHHDAESLKT